MMIDATILCCRPRLVVSAHRGDRVVNVVLVEYSYVVLIWMLTDSQLPCSSKRVIKNNVVT